ICDVGIGGGEKYQITDKNKNIHIFCMIGNKYKVCLITEKGDEILGYFNGTTGNDYILISGKKYSYSNSDIIVISCE
ncbi:MAG: hypothetical protein K2N27_08930, partial [Ruminococcus sp.]|nr:hypothetical protein [Ruminococcus sp.]